MKITVIQRFTWGLGLCLSLPGLGLAAAFDMRDCPTDRLTYVNSWSKESFEVTRVGSIFYHVCGDGREITYGPEAKSDPSCYGPYGMLYLAGIHKSGGEQNELNAIYTLSVSGAPCCGWTVAQPDDRKERERPIEWLSGGDVPPLGMWPLDAISNEWGGPGDLNGMIPMICRDPLSQ